MFLIIRFKAERERMSISTSILFSSLPVGYHRVRTYEKKRNYWRGRCPGGKYTHDDSLNHLRKKYEAPNHLRGSVEIHPLLYYIMPNYDS